MPLYLFEMLDADGRKYVFRIVAESPAAAIDILQRAPTAELVGESGVVFQANDSVIN